MNPRLRERRRRAGLTQDELADLSEVSQSMVSALELGRITAPSAGTVDRLAKTLGCTPEEIGYERRPGYQLIDGGTDRAMDPAG